VDDITTEVTVNILDIRAALWAIEDHEYGAAWHILDTILEDYNEGVENVTKEE